MKDKFAISPDHIDEYNYNKKHPDEGLYDYAKRVGIDLEKIDDPAEISSEPDLTPKPRISNSEFSVMKCKYDILKDQYNKLQNDYKKLLHQYVPIQELHNMVLKVHPFCNTCMRFEPVVKDWVQIQKVKLFYDNPSTFTPEHKPMVDISGNTVISCEFYDECCLMEEYIRDHYKKNSE